MDRLARALVSLGGITIIGSILAILFVIVIEFAPLFRGASAVQEARIALKSGARTIAVGEDDSRDYLYTVDAGGVRVWRMADGSAVNLPSLTGLEGSSVRCVADHGRGTLALGLSDGQALLVQVRFAETFPEGKRVVVPSIAQEPKVRLDDGGRPLRLVGFASSESVTLLAGTVGPRDLSFLFRRKKKTLMGEKVDESRQVLALPITDEVTALAVDSRGEDLFAGTSSGGVIRIDLRSKEGPRIADTLSSKSPGSAVTALSFLLGDRTLVVGGARGEVTTAQLVLSEGGLTLRWMQEFVRHEAPVIAISPSFRDKGFLTADSGGGIHLNYGTTGSTLLELRTEAGPLASAALAPKANGILAVTEDGRLWPWKVDNPHPEATFGSLFGKVQYEGYEKPEHVWQSTGSDESEAKYGLTKLIFGTLKGTFYALLFAVPLALLSALYVSQFMHPHLKGTIKPIVEVMAALPSVVLGFIAGLWLAPLVEHNLPGLALAPLIMATLVLLSVAGWRAVPLRYRQRLKHGSEVFLIIPVLLIGAWIALVLGGWVESSFLMGDHRAWLRKVFDVTYDQRNALVVGFAMGFAVVPIIFTIAEDSLSNVPAHLTAGSLALGATRWQTALRVVLPTASPGIFSAVMIGFGRAVGETMIVLMATGNTAILSLSPFNGFRALSANVATEMSEAPVGGTLFRVLFLAAFLLFLMTFLVNTLAEAVRLRLRKRYQFL
jgi:phosphate transport system permease protein